MAVLYRKYRPQTFAEMVGQDNVVNALKRAISADKSPHALLFVGPKGSGKTTTARILAKALNCQDVKNGDPCGKCEICEEIARGAAVDVIEIDGASNRKIDDVREIRDKISLSPSEFSKKVYIIDEVHMLTKEAFNALLKTLEEPPSHAVFILCTTEPDKLPATIISRCQRFDFNLGRGEEIKKYLEEVLTKEKVAYDAEALAWVAEYASGSFRDALSMAGQVAVFEKVTLEVVQNTLGAGRNGEAKNFVTALFDEDRKKAVEVVTKLSEKGFDSAEFVKNALMEVKNLLLNKINNPAEGYSQEEIINVYNSLDKCFQRIKYSPVAELPLLLVIAELIETNGTKTKISNKEKNEIKSEVRSENKNIAADDIKEAKSEETESKVPEIDIEPNETKEDASVYDVAVVSDSGGSDELQTIYNNWKAILENLRAKNIYVTTILRGGKPTAFDGNKVTVEVYFKLHQDKLRETKILKLVESSMSEVLGKKVFLLINVGKKEITATSDLSIENLVEAAGEIFGTSN